MQPLQYDFRDPAAKDNSITNAATARSNLDAAITMRSAETELQNTIELRATASEIVAPKPDSTPERKKDDFEALFKRIFRRKITSAKMEKICWQITVAAFMQPLQYDLRSPAAKDNSITNAATARSNLDAAITMRSAETELQNTIELRATASEIVAPKPDSTPERKKDDFEALFKRIFRRKITSAKMEKICWQITVAAFMQPLQYDLRSPAAKDNSITNAATARSNLDAAITMRSAETELQTAIPFTLRERSYSCKAEWNSIGNSSTSNTCNPIYIAGTILQLQITMEFHRQHPPAPLAIPFTLRERSYSCKSQWNSVDRTCTKNSWNPIYNAEPIRAWSENDPTTHETVSHPSHRRGRSSRFGDGLCMEKHRVSCICYLSKTHFVRDFLQNSIGNIHQHHLQSHLHCGNDPTVANHNGILSTARARKTVETPFTMRNRSEHDPRMIRPHTRPSRTRRTAEVDHRGSGTDFVWKNTGFRASAISQKRISCETSFKTPSATHPPASLAIPFTLREQFLWLTRSLTNSFFANSFFALSLTNSFFANSFFDYLIYPD